LEEHSHLAFPILLFTSIHTGFFLAGVTRVGCFFDGTGIGINDGIMLLFA